MTQTPYDPNQQQPAPQVPYTPPRKRHTLRTIAIIVGALFAGFVAIAVLTPGTPAKDAAAPVSITSKAGTVEPPAVVKTTAPVAPPKTTAAPQPAETTAPEPTVAPEPAMTASQEQAIGSAEQYLDFTAFSRKGLIQQLSSDAVGFSKADATFAVDHITVNWNEQAAKSAETYLGFTHFSRSGLIQQLESDAVGFTHRQAVYGVTKAGL